MQSLFCNLLPLIFIDCHRFSLSLIVFSLMFIALRALGAVRCLGGETVQPFGIAVMTLATVAHHDLPGAPGRVHSWVTRLSLPEMTGDAGLKSRAPWGKGRRRGRDGGSIPPPRRSRWALGDFNGGSAAAGGPGGRPGPGILGPSGTGPMGPCWRASPRATCSN